MPFPRAVRVPKPVAAAARSASPAIAVASATAPAPPAPAAPAQWKSSISFYLNGKRKIVRNPDPSMMLVDYVRDVANLKGTKIGCREGGCGACTVVLSHRDARTGADVHRAINSCLRPLCAVDGLAVTTIEGVGSEKAGLHPIQARLADNNGTQCGFCSPGWVMSMYGLLRDNAAPEAQEVQRHTDGNLCRCTGYRPILEAFQTFAPSTATASCGGPSTATASCGGPAAGADVEDLVTKFPYAPSEEPPLPAGVAGYVPAPLAISDDASGKTWLRPTELPQLFEILRSRPGERIELVRGHTAAGVTKYYNNNEHEPDQFDVFVDVNALSELSGVSSDEHGLHVGASVSITDLVAALREHDPEHGGASAERPSLFENMARHLTLVANTSIRNAGSWAGNLMLMRRHGAFPSDVVLTLATALGSVTWADARGFENTTPILEFATGCGVATPVVLSVCVPWPTVARGQRRVARSWKVAQRAVNAHAHCNAGFNVLLDADGTVHHARLVFGGVSARTFSAERTARLLQGRPLDQAALADALDMLDTELRAVGPNTGFGDQAYRQALMQNLTYKFFLYAQEALPAPLQSAVAWNERPISGGTQEFESDESEAPVSLPVRKLAGKLQCTGEAKYAADETRAPDTLFGAWVISQRPLATLLAIDARAALQMPGVVDLVTAADVPGSNDLSQYETLFVPVGGVVRFIGDSVALVLAESTTQAEAAARAVALTYGPAPGNAQPVLSVEDAIAADSFFDNIPEAACIETGDPDAAMAAAPHVVSGTIDTDGQQHWYMEPQTTLACPVEGDKWDVRMSTQHAGTSQPTLAAVLGLADNKINVIARRAGGAFGGKGNRAVPNAAAALVAANKHGCQVLVTSDRNVDMERNAGRQSLQAKYQVGFDDEGNLLSVIVSYFMPAGVCESPSGASYMAMYWADACYRWPAYRWTAQLPALNIAPSTSCRAPGVVQSVYVTEALVQHVASALGMPADEVRAKNFLQVGDTTPYGQELEYVSLPTVWSELKAKAAYDDTVAEVEAFNAASRWVKRGVSITPCKYGISSAGYAQACVITVSGSDASIRATCGGAEIGQGLLTKVAQAIAMKLGVEMDTITIDELETKRTPNNGNTGGSGTSEACVASALASCENLLATLAPFRTGDADSFADLVAAAVAGGANVTSTGWYNPDDEGQVFMYFVYCACVSVVELDVLTGQLTTESSKIVYDCGTSLNPAIDIGQIEGAFIQGLGYFHTEEQVFQQGRLMTDGTWEYKPPSSYDVPLELDVSLLADAPNPVGVLSSKATGEPPYALANSVLFAAKSAVEAARADGGVSSDEYLNLPAPASVAVLQRASLTTRDMFTLS